MKKFLLSTPFILGSALVFLFALNQFLYSRGVSWSGIYADEDAAERAALRKLSHQIRLNPQATQCVASWTYRGTNHAFSEVDGTTSYDRKPKLLRHIYTYAPKDSYRIEDVKDIDITITASHNGNYDDLETQIEKRQKQEKSQKRSPNLTAPAPTSVPKGF